MEFDLAINGMPTYVFCKFEMLIFKRVLVIKYYVRFAFQFVFNDLQHVFATIYYKINCLYKVFAIAWLKNLFRIMTFNQEA